MKALSSPFFWRSSELLGTGACSAGRVRPCRPCLEVLVLLEQVDALPLSGRVVRGRLGRQGLDRLAGDHVADAAADEGHDQGEDGEGAAQEPALEALGEEIAQGHQPDAAHEGGGEPVERGQEEDQVLDPHAADALPVDLAGDGHGLVGVGRGPEVEEELVELAHSAAGQVEIAGGFVPCLAHIPSRRITAT